MLIIGLTGGISSGKTTVAHYFADLGIDVIDADKIAKNLVQPKNPLFQKITHHFGKEIIDAKGQLDRGQLRKIIFKDPKEKEWLEKLLHPPIIQVMKKELKKAKSPYVILVIPLLIETQTYDLVNRILVIDTSIDHQIKRTQQRDNINDQEIKAIINTQATREERLAKADDIITNNLDFTEIQKQVTALHKKYLKLSL